MPDKVPDPPKKVTTEAGYQRVTVKWDVPDYVGTKPDSYTVTLTGSGGGSVTKETSGNSLVFPIDNSATGDGTSYTATVKGKNRAGEGQPSAASNAADALGRPGRADGQPIGNKGQYIEGHVDARQHAQRGMFQRGTERRNLHVVPLRHPHLHRYDQPRSVV